MKKILLASIAGAAALMAIAPANAADLGLYATPLARVPVFTWTGCYIGGNVGWGWGRETVSIPNLAETTGVPELAGFPSPPLQVIPRGFSVAVRSAAIINLHPTG